MRGTLEDLATLFEVSLDMLCIRDMDGKLVRVNQAWQEVLGYPIDALEGAAMLGFVHPDDIAATSGQMGRIHQENEIRSFINRYRHRDGHYRSLEWRAKRVGDLVFGFARDVTDRLAYEAEIKEAKLKAEAANQAKSDFLANMSHEILTPLNGVIGIVDALSHTDLAPSQRDMLMMLRSSAHTLERLVSDILEVSKIEAGGLRIEIGTFDLRGDLAGLFNQYRRRAEEKGLAYALDYGDGAAGAFQGDVVRIKQVLGNLLANAIKFTSNGVVRVSIKTTELPGAEGPVLVDFEIDDSGVGFPPEFASALFTRFSQADSSITRRFGGSGLGLAIAKSLVDAMGGEIDARSVPGQGSSFRLRLPLMRGVGTGAAAAREAEVGAIARRGLRVLLAEDHPINRKIIEVFLGPNEAVLTAVANGAEAVAAFRAGEYDLILMDMQMPVMDGITATRALRAYERETSRPATPIIILTANALPEHAESALSAGADQHIAKPLTAKALIAGINQALGGVIGREG